eukprot:1917630-Rhodomonas_salina.2
MSGIHITLNGVLGSRIGRWFQQKFHPRPPKQVALLWNMSAPEEGVRDKDLRVPGGWEGRRGHGEDVKQSEGRWGVGVTWNMLPEVRDQLPAMVSATMSATLSATMITMLYATIYAMRSATIIVPVSSSPSGTKPGAIAATLSAYAWPVRCPVLSQRMQAIEEAVGAFRQRIAECSPVLTSGAHPTDRIAVSVLTKALLLHLAYHPTDCLAVRGTDFGYAATRKRKRRSKSRMCARRKCVSAELLVACPLPSYASLCDVRYFCRRSPVSSYALAMQCVRYSRSTSPLSCQVFAVKCPVLA